MNHGPSSLALLLALATLPLLAQAQTIWRCGPDGRSFSDAPCADGRALALADTRPSQDVAEAEALAERDKRLAEKLRRERLKEEAAQRGNGLAALGPVAGDAPSRGVKRPGPLSREQQRAKPPVQRQTQGRPAAPADGTWRAIAPASRRAKG